MDYAAEYAQHADIVEPIFFPAATRRLWAMRKSAGKFVHYTTADAALSIIQSQSMWLRSTTCMNDYSEIQHGFRLLNATLSEPGCGDALKDALDRCHLGLWQKAIDTFNHWWGDMQGFTFIACLSEHLDEESHYGRLSMWRAYGGSQNARVGLVLRVPLSTGTAIPLGVVFTPTAYIARAALLAQIHEIIENIRENQVYLANLSAEFVFGLAFAMLRMAVVSLKHPGFSEEREWRIALWPNMPRPDPWLVKEDTKTIGGIPQKIYMLPLKDAANGGVDGLSIPQLIDRVIIGPTQFSTPIVATFIEALNKAGVPDAATRVVASDIPLRT